MKHLLIAISHPRVEFDVSVAMTFEIVLGFLIFLIMSQVNIGVDHRMLDGAAVAKFCTEWKSFVEKPDLLLLHTQ